MARPTTKQKKAAIRRMKAAATIMKSKTASKAQKAAAKRSRDAANKIRKKGGTITELRAKGIGLPAYSGEGSILGTQELYDETIKYRDKVENMSYDEAAAIRAAAELARSKATTPALKELQSARMRAAGDRMRLLTGRQKGQGTPYTGPGSTVKLDSKGNIVRDATGRVQYEIDPAAYAGRFIPQFKPTEEQLGMGLNIQPGLLTPWQQTNFQWLLGGEGLDPTAEGRIPGAFRQNWREEQWGDVYDAETGLWTRAEDPQVRANAVAEQLRRYNAGEFNPTVGSVAGDRWTGPGIGVPSADQWLPPGWTPPGGGGGVVGGGGGLGGGAYTPMAAQDWSGIMPQGVFAGSAVQPTQAMQGLVANQGQQYQPWAMPDNSVAGSPFVSQNVQYNAPLNYSAVGSTTTTNGGDTTTTTNGAEKTHWDRMAEHYDLIGQAHINGMIINQANTDTTTDWVNPDATINVADIDYSGLRTDAQGNITGL